MRSHRPAAAEGAPPRIAEVPHQLLRADARAHGRRGRVPRDSPPILIRPAAPIQILQVLAPTLVAPKDVDLASPAVGEGVGFGLGGSVVGAGSGAEWGSHAPTPTPDVETRGPVWERKPTRAEVHAAHPHAAYLAKLRGWGRLGCRIRSDGKVDHCIVLEEAPAGHGFGTAALRLSLAFRFRPFTVGGRPHEILVVIPYEFDVAKADTNPSARQQ